MKVLADFHHQSLYHSLHLLFENRLGWELYRPIGTGWHKEGYWKVYDHPHTVEQFLGLYQGNELPMDVHGVALPEHERKNLRYTVEDGVYYVYDMVYKSTHRAITLEKFKNMDFDILLASMPQHIQPYHNLIQLYQPKAKHIFQIGNAWGMQQGAVNIMSSTASFETPPGVNAVFYHQEFDTNLFSYQAPDFHNVVHSYVHYMRHPELMDQIVTLLPGWKFTRYGAGMTDNIMQISDMAAAMKRSAFTWHYKPEGDGFGHSIHNSYACGRPAIIWGPHYRGKLAGELLQDGITCIDAHGKSPQQLAASLQAWSMPGPHELMCVNAHRRFQQVVNFDTEFESIKQFLNRLR